MIRIRPGDLPMSFELLLGGVAAALLLVFLTYVLFNPEKF